MLGRRSSAKRSGEDTYHILVFTDGGDGKGNVEYAIQVGDNTIYDVRGTFTMKKNNIMETKYQEQIKNGAWGPIDEGRVDEDRFQYEVEDGQVTALLPCGRPGELDGYVLSAAVIGSIFIKKQALWASIPQRLLFIMCGSIK